MKHYFRKVFQNPDYLAIISMVVIWKVALLIILLSSFEFLPLYAQQLLGGGYENYVMNYYILPWANFDGEHYLSIALSGYKQYQQAFFPLFPWLISILMNVFGDNVLAGAISGLLISSISFPLALIFLYKLIRLDYSSKFAMGVILVVLLYPASFYFNAVYNEALFLMLIVMSFYFFRTKHFFWASIFGFLASTTRVFGILIFISFLLEIFIYRIPIKKTYWIFLIPFGLLSYMTYLYYSVGDPLAFYNLQLIVGEQHQRGIVLLPQVIFRYLKMIFAFETLNPLFTTILFELAVGILFSILPLIGLFYKVRLSYLFFALMGFILPTIQGSFSSLPRYVLILFPSFIVLTLMIKKLPMPIKILLAFLSAALLIFETAFFLRGYWVS